MPAETVTIFYSMICKFCQSTKCQIKYGKSRTGLQRYKCKLCNRTYTYSQITQNSYQNGAYVSLEICAGAGGQAIGLERAGFSHLGLLEIDPKACSTLRLNRPHWSVFEMDVRDFDGYKYRGKVDLLAGGIPCPPFSVAGKQLGADDERNLFDEVLRLAREIRPKAIMIENVKGLLSKAFDNLRGQVTDQLKRLGYVVYWKLLQSSDFGVPQLRPRTLMVALLSEYAGYFEWPQPSKDSAPPTVGEVLFDEMASNGWRQVETWKQQANQIAPTIVGGSTKHGGPDLGPTRAKQAWAKLGVNGHTIANDPPSAEFTGMPSLTVSMAAKLQGFPDDWQFSGRKTAAYRQVGNAFPPPVAQAIGAAIKAALDKQYKYNEDEVASVPWQRELVLETN